MIGAQSASSVRYGGELGSFRNVPWWGRPGWFDAAVPERCYGVAVFVIYVASRCILRRGSSRVGLPDLDHPPAVTRWRFFRFHVASRAFVALEAIGRPESLPAAVEIVKERGGSQQNTLRRVRRAFT